MIPSFLGGKLLIKDGMLCTTCCGTITPPTPCQWVVVFTYNTSGCFWETTTAAYKSTGPVESLHTAGEECVRSGGTLVITRYGTIQTDGNCGDTPPDGFDTLPLDGVFYLGCATGWSGDEGGDCVTMHERKHVAIFVASESSSVPCPDFPKDYWGVCLHYYDYQSELGLSGAGYDWAGSKVEMLGGGPFCSYDQITEWETANPDDCTPIDPPG